MPVPAKLRVVYWQNIPSPYFVGRFNMLADRGNLDFEAWFNEEREPDRSWMINPAEWRFRARYIPTRSLLGWHLHLPLAELQAVRPHILISLYDRASFALGCLGARSVTPRLAFRVLPNYESWAGRTWWRELGKHFMFRCIDGAIVPGPDGAALGARYGLPRNRTQPVTQSIDVAHYSQARMIDPGERHRRRAQWGVSGCVFVYAGRLWRGKGLDYLLEAYRLVQTQWHDVSLLVLGDGVDEARYRAMASTLPGITFAGFVQARDMPRYYALADVLVFPTLGDPHGLVIDEAMAAGLPVISSDAAGDIRQRLPDGQAGYIVPAADAYALSRRMLQLATDADLRRRFAQEGMRLVESHTHERWAQDFESFVGFLRALPPRRTLAAVVAHGLGQVLMCSRSGSPAPSISPR
jgi:glycosyltransferase involved in cell wall biosynthesis